MNCYNSTHCELPLTFWSHDHVVIEVPETQPVTNGSEVLDACSEESLLQGFSSVEECHRILIAESICKPRMVIYMMFLFLVPIFILFCANI